MCYLVWTLAWIGLLALLLLAAMAILRWINVHDDNLQAKRERIEHEGFKTQLARVSRWFNEDPITFRLLQDLASGMSAASARDEWRKARAEERAAREPSNG